MLKLSTIAEVRGTVRDWHRGGERIAFVPTMGNLHAGHLRLVERARQVAPRTVVSIFVNPTQFGPREDYTTYPRTPEADQERLAAAGVDMLFAPTVEEMYPGGVEEGTRVEVPSLSDILCGAFRAGHFSGVATVVSKLFNIVQPDIALFGEKDYQQLLVVRRMVLDLAIPVALISVPTVREPDGLAMSSRNAYLSSEERQRAPILYRSLLEAKARIDDGEGSYATIEARGLSRLRACGFRPAYFSVRRADDLALPTREDAKLVVLAAAWLGRTRLIDNVPILKGNG
jgi:pantoate--beta-alanine ligase